MQRSATSTGTVARSSEHHGAGFPRFGSCNISEGGHHFSPAAHPLAYEDYVHVETRRYAMIPVSVNPETGERVVLVTPSWLCASQQPGRWRAGRNFLRLASSLRVEGAELLGSCHSAGLSSATR